MTAAIFAHQGGWDEILFVAVPIAIFAALLAVANRRASQIEEAREADEPEDDPPKRGRGESGRGQSGR